MGDLSKQGRPRPETWRLVLDEGEALEVRLIDSSGVGGDIELRLPAWRAVDLALVLEAYSRLTAVVTEATAVSGTEQSLARALRDAAVVASGRQAQDAGPSKVSTAGRLKAMAQLQKFRPDFSHSKLVSVIDAAAWWLDAGQDLMASDLLEAVVTEEDGIALHRTLVGVEAPDVPEPGGSGSL
jgi:hypothetical protein